MNDSIKLSLLKVIILFICLLFMLFILPYTYSRYESASSTEITTGVAYYILDTVPISENIRLDSLVPSADPYVFNFTISNNDGVNRLETVLSYDLTLRTTTNLPLELELYMNEDFASPYATQLVSEDVVQDEYGTYFRTFSAPTAYFNYFYDETNVYTLVVYFPKEFNSFEYQGILESLELTIDSKQVIDSELIVLDNRVIHLDASSIEGLSNNDAVSVWPDLSGNGNNAIQSTGLNRPVFLENVMNGLPVIRYSGNTHMSILDSPELRVNPEMTIFAVVNLNSRTTGTNNIRTITSKESSWNDRNWWLVHWDNHWVFRQSSTGSENLISDSVSSLEPTIIGISANGDEMKMFIDGIEQSTSISYNSFDTQNSLVGIGRQGDSTNRNWVGDIAEIIIYDSALTDNERQSVESYLGNKWLGW